ncbi:MAG: F0F1 ATP synthase subunit epsilon, partial [Betaproteobacteria bacterium]|nr:F0F1 ATP synthase subunit epsilon [Betaproteobacteria bacterium]
ERANAAKALAEEALRNAKSDVDMAVAQAELSTLVAQIAALRRFQNKR